MIPLLLTALNAAQAAANQSSTSPLFTDDVVGFAKIVSLLVGVVLLPTAGLVVYFLKSGTHAEVITVRGEVAALRIDLNGVGGRMNATEGELAAMHERVNSIYSAIAESQRDIMSAITASGRAQTDATHHVELAVARLEERNNLAEGLAGFGASIERLATAIAKRPEVRG